MKPPAPDPIPVPARAALPKAAQGAPQGAPAAWEGALSRTAPPADLQARLGRERLLPAACLEAPREAVALARALSKGGLHLLQVSLNSARALECIGEIRSELPDLDVGACDVLSAGQLREARAAGAHFASSPVTHSSLLQAALSLEFPLIPGVMTPSEIAEGIQCGFLLQCVYPAEPAGGVPMLRALLRPFRHTPLQVLAAGGVRPSNFQEYLAVPQVAAVSGRFLCDPALIAAALWEDVEAQIQLFLEKSGALSNERDGPVRATPHGKSTVAAGGVFQ